MPETPSLRRNHIEQILTLFSNVPTLREVAITQVQATLDRRFPAFNLLAERVAIGTPMQADQYHYSLLADEVMVRLTSARPMRYIEDYHQVCLRQREIHVPGGPPLAAIEQVVNQLGPNLLQAWLERLEAWWRATVSVNTTRWAYLSDDCLALLYDSQKPPGMDEQQFARLFPRTALRASRPDREWSLHGATLQVQTVHVRPQGSQTSEMLPLLILAHRLPGAELPALLLFSPATGLHPLARLEDIEPLIPDYLSQRLVGPTLEWFVQVPWGDPFDALAASYAERQRADVLAIDLTVPRTPAQFQHMLDYVTDPSRWFESVLTPFQLRLQDQLPLWLIHASAADSLAYARALQALVVAQAAAGGRSFVDGIAPLGTFAAQALKQCLRKDRRADGIEPEDIEMTYHIVTAAMTPGGFATGEVHPVSLSLTDLALANLGGFPHLPSSIHLNGSPAPDWLTATLLKGCVTEVDIGQTYPALLQQTLVDDAAERQRREGLFTRQVRAQLPLLALQMKIKGEHGLTEAGYRLVQAAVMQQPEAAFWPLAFEATPTSSPDAVVNLYVIGPRQSEEGPHLLYQPLFSPCLREFATAQALFDAIKAPGELQDTVLAWLPATRQAMYANGGFEEPHVRRFLAGDEFSVPERPAPARLSKQPLAADPLPQVFASTVQALVSLAQRQSVSNAEQRWATLKEGGWLLFNSLLPFLRGPVALVGWMVQVMDSVQQDVQAISGNQPALQASGVMDLLSNLVLILAHRASPHEWPSTLDLQHPAFEPTPRRLAPATLVRGPLDVQLRAPGGWSNARDTLTADLKARLEQLSLKAFALPWPVRLPGAQVGGRLNGMLFNPATQPPQWQVLVRGHLYRARVTDNSVRIISADGRVSGPWLKLVDNVYWDVDLSLRLRLIGGQPDTPVAGADTESRHEQLERDYRQYGQRRETANRAMVVAYTLKTSDAASVTDQQRATASSRYTQELQSKLEASLLELRCLKALQLLKPRAGYERELSTSLEGLILSLRQLLMHARATTVAINARLVPVLDRVQSLSEDEATWDVNQQAHQVLMEGLRQLADSNENAIRWRTQELNLLQELEAVPKFGRDRAQALRQSELVGPTVLELQSLQVTALWAVALKTEGPRLDEDFFQSLDDTIQRARWASGSQAQLDELAPHSTELRIELLESFNRVYAQTDDRIEFWRAMEPDKFHLDYLDKLQQLFTQLHAEVERELSAALMPANPAPRPVPAPRAPRKNIIRTRNQGLYVAQLKMTTGEQPTQVAEVLDAQNSVIASFTPAADGIWEPVEKAAPRRAGSMPSLNRLIEQGQALRAAVEQAIGEVLKMARRANEPQSLQDILEQRADKLRQCAEAIQRHLQHSEPARLAATQRARARTEADALRAAASRLSEQGLQARLNAIKARLPTQSGVDVLVSHHEANIFRQGGRVALAARPNDWLQAYGVVDVHTRQPLWYAHFHYERQAGPDDHFTAAHLKTPEQHRMGKQTQAQAQAQAFASIQAGQGGRASQALEIHRGEINLRMARKLFFDAPQWRRDE
ncbi:MULTISPECIES: hypothetical protein [unclassified Pseudomonas]|uniref:hypothetical protein n=1 Tax=unclassified Pseudomonas TaxID=196821 RepID=UPI00160A6AEC|nr:MULTISPECIES: hypothetical protein [unclassified Pseudomonas]MBB6288336.1 hypothetical protein [Pseudomonas sp. SJZ073]MBB6313308.1 hypothetical protein [Pseudomonas sp. JAI120]